jgi:hypothetical protein
VVAETFLNHSRAGTRRGAAATNGVQLRSKSKTRAVPFPASSSFDSSLTAFGERLRRLILEMHDLALQNCEVLKRRLPAGRFERAD